jgi:hypothetical protein
MTFEQPDLFGDVPAKQQQFDALEVASRIAATARDNPYAEQELRAARIAEQREGRLITDQTETQSMAPAKPDGHDEYEPLTRTAESIGLPAVQAIRNTLKR